jgi:hypothetical protein
MLIGLGILALSFVGFVFRRVVQDGDAFAWREPAVRATDAEPEPVRRESSLV